ncbi:MAG: TIR domain-containing protein [Nitrospirota bacterium]
MARRVFFSFHYQKDRWRVNQIRMAHIVEGTAAAGWHDASLWEEAKRKGDGAVKALIDRGLDRTTVTAVLIGSQTANRDYVKCEIDMSKRGKSTGWCHPVAVFRRLSIRTSRERDEDRHALKGHARRF